MFAVSLFRTSSMTLFSILSNKSHFMDGQRFIVAAGIHKNSIAKEVQLDLLTPCAGQALTNLLQRGSLCALRDGQTSHEIFSPSYLVIQILHSTS